MADSKAGYRYLTGYIKLTGIAKGSLEELKLDYENSRFGTKTIQECANLLITLISLNIFLLDRLIKSLKVKHMREGGLTEELYRKRINYRNKT